MFDGNDFRCPIPAALLPGNLSCVCGNGHTATSELSLKPLDHGIGATARIPASRAIEICVPCPEGWYSNATTGQKCFPCPAGTVPSRKADHCEPCLPGSFSNESGAHLCLPCAQGTFTADIGATLCISCNPGQFAAEQSSTKCADCPAGTFSGSKGSSVCTSCPRGTYVSAEGEAECLLCPKGTYQDGAGSAVCKACPVGYIAPQPGHVKCSLCHPGSFYDVSLKTCTLCRPRTFTAAEAQIECSNCENGTIAEGGGSDRCLAVAAPGWGYTAADIPLQCKSGTYNDGSWRTCQLCPPGTFASDGGSKMCSKCTKGSFASQYGSTDCVPAPRGSFVQQEGATRAELCPPNYHVDKSGSTMCEPCQAPSFSFLPGGDKCTLAEPGEVYERVEWPRLALDLAGLGLHDLLTQDDHVSPIDVLIQIWTDTLTSYSGTNRPLHVLQVHESHGASQSTQIIAAIEVENLLAPGTRTDSSGLDKGLNDAMQQAAEDAESALDDLLDELKGSASGEGLQMSSDIDQLAALVRLRPFRDALVRQFDEAHLLSGAWQYNLVNVSKVEPLFISIRAVACPTGKYFTVTADSKRSCQSCPVGSYSSTSGALECKPCPRGTFTAKAGRKVCKACPAGADSVPGAASCVECSWFTYECQDFWQNLIVAMAVAMGLLFIVYQKIHRLFVGDKAQQLQDESVALMATVRAHGRTFDGVRYAPMGTISVDTIFGLVPRVQDTQSGNML
uniref:TNFR-Cys domain-containing protein n=1 Tax=Hyaloperonospora arabidopsidis (strain Emoy2) TaxID=559515 RepID=M4BEN6_HYAAE